jgi:DNA-binding MarR family transcriptional regulator
VTAPSDARSYIEPMSRLEYDPAEASYRHWLTQGWDESADGVAAVISVMRTWQILLTRANALLRPLGLTFARYQVLGLLRSRHPLTLGQVGTSLWITPGTVTSSVDRLEASGFIKRLPHPTDGRTVLVEITPKGRKVVEKAVNLLNDGLFSALPLSAQESAQLVKLMNKVRADAGDVVGPAGGGGRAKKRQP